ncbi:MAG TPA: Mov34/MPN/PAD-1 family protein [Ideonella sp.]|uniref:Mov34/MPN/PAD-1 family protein n=1 Tax=Ideonella sp. TaxID=1929293 RepID=UPI002BC77769|nr:Mov34/MPN/PAD-1 family protein [Ideonella sp.]HSI49185.1 Mov34/MPN/PAD-1 family protein [Ideonella sp.]
MSSTQLTFRLPDAAWTLEFGAEVLRMFEECVQRHRWSKESVGQLFTRDLTSTHVLVEVSTLLKPTLATRARVRFDTRAATAEREAMFERGLHCVGLWHTHPEPAPQPSPEDRALARDHARAAKPQVSGVVFVIIGTLPIPAGLRVWVDNGLELRRAELQET